METNDMKKTLLALAFFTFFSCFIGWSQNIPPLERKVSITFQGVQIESALSRLSQAGGFTFSYSPTILNSNQLVTREYTEKTVREILNVFFGESILVKGKGNYVILTKAAAPTKKEIENNTVTITGYVTNGDTGEKIAEVSVYNKKSLTATISDQFGFFKITLDNPDQEAELHFSKRSFLDTLIVLKTDVQFINMLMLPENLNIAEVQPIKDTVEVVTGPIAVRPPVVRPDLTSSKKRTFREFLQEEIFSKNIFSKKSGDVNMQNIKDPIYRDFQVSFVPFVGTNHKLSGNVVNGYSLNILGGYSMGTTKAEFGGLFNIDRGDVSYAQFAGLFNTVGGRTNGGQFAGLGNLTRKKVEGGQFAGLFNANLDSVKAGQFAGLFNVNGRASEGAQIAGLFNIQPSYYKGVQVAGLFNVATHQMYGTQIAGLVNYAHNIHGGQIGLINYADSIRGVPLGLMSIVSKGYHKIEFSADEVFYINAAFRTGVRQFYNILQAGMKPESFDDSTNPGALNPDQENIWTFGYGIGTAPKLTKWLYLNVDLTANHVNKGSFTNSVSLLNKLYLGFDFQVAKKFSITAGATLNGYLSDPTYSDNPTLFTDFNPSIIKSHSFTNGNELKMWWGGKVGIRFL
ncbi:MAG: hypothetical protein RH948_10190 [Cyclobacteriaceae bacterium]